MELLIRYNTSKFIFGFRNLYSEHYVLCYAYVNSINNFLEIIDIIIVHRVSTF